MIGQTISHYRLDKKLGEGTYGQVFRGTHLHDPAMQVAIKVVHKNLSNDADFVANLRRECVVLAALSHRHIVSYRDLVLGEDHPPAMVLELLDGTDLHAVCQRGPMAIAQVVRVVEAMLDGLSWAHKKGVVHRDIKPSNVMLCQDGEVKLLDFGIARAADASKATKTGVIQGTLDYVAPEVFEGAKADSAADVYATGLVAWELLVGRAACPVGSPKSGWHMGVALPDVRLERTDCPDWLAELVNTLSAKDLGVRPGDGAAALAMLRSAVPAGGVVEPKRVVAEVPRGPGTVVLHVDDLAVSGAASRVAPAVSQTPVQRPPIAGPNTVALPVARSKSPVRSESFLKVKASKKESAPSRLLVLLAALAGAVLAITTSVGLWVAVTGDDAPVELPKASTAKDAPVEVPLEAWTNSLGMIFVKIPAGSFTMGCTAEQGPDCESDEKPAHNVTLTHSFWMQTTEVTQGQWAAVMSKNPSGLSSCGDDCPVERVSWHDAVAFAQKLSAKEGLSGGSAYRLPTEAEWEYAARAGQSTKYAGSNSLDAVAWHKGNSDGKTHRVGEKSPNAWGLYDMSGNVWEWTGDWYGRYSSGDKTNPEGASSGSHRVNRGGSWRITARYTRVAIRTGTAPSARRILLGLRLSRSEY